MAPPHRPANCRRNPSPLAGIWTAMMNTMRVLHVYEEREHDRWERREQFSYKEEERGLKEKMKENKGDRVFIPSLNLMCASLCHYGEPPLPGRTTNLRVAEALSLMWLRRCDSDQAIHIRPYKPNAPCTCLRPKSRLLLSAPPIVLSVTPCL